MIRARTLAQHCEQAHSHRHRSRSVSDARAPSVVSTLQSPCKQPRGQIESWASSSPPPPSPPPRLVRIRAERLRRDAVHRRTPAAARTWSLTRTAAATSSGASRRTAATPAKVGYCHIPAGGSACDSHAGSSTSRRPPGRSRRWTRSKVTIHRAALARAPDPRLVPGCGDGSAVDHVYTWGSTTNGTIVGPRRAVPARHDADADGDPARRRLDRRHEPVRLAGRGHRDARLPDRGRGRHALPRRQLGLRLHAEHGPGADGRRRAAGDRSGLEQPRLDPVRRLPGRHAQRTTVGSELQLVDRQDARRRRAGHRRAAPDAGPANAYMTYRRTVPGDNQILLRRFSSSSKSFAPSTPIQGADPIDNSADGPTRPRTRPAACTSSGPAATTPDACATRARPTPAPTFRRRPTSRRARPSTTRRRRRPDGNGWAAWAGRGDAPIRVVRLEPYAEKPADAAAADLHAAGDRNATELQDADRSPPSKTVTKTVAVKGGSISFGRPARLRDARQDVQGHADLEEARSARATSS